MTSSGTRHSAAQARERILDAGIRCLVRDGVAGASMAAIAAESTVSKALLHYHFDTRERLVADMVTTLARRLIDRQRTALDSGSTEEGPVDALWRLVKFELEQGELRALLALDTVRDPKVRLALEAASAGRRGAATDSVTQLFDRLSLTLRVPAAMIAEAMVAFMDGLAIDEEHGAHNARTSFDVFWLAVLSLGD